MAMKTNCPLCKSEAEYIEKDYGILRFFKCQTCKFFIINRSAIRILETASEDQLKKFSDLSKSLTEDKVLNICGESGDCGAVTGKVISRSEIPFS